MAGVAFRGDAVQSRDVLRPGGFCRFPGGVSVRRLPLQRLVR